MLSEHEEAIIASGLTCCDQDFFSRAATVGEPFLCDGLVCYFDGFRAEIVGVPLSASVSDAELHRRVAAAVDKWQHHDGVGVIDYLGAVLVDTSCDSDWPCLYSDDPFDSNFDVFIDLTLPLIDRVKVRQDVRRALRRGIEVSVQPRPILGHEHIALLEHLTSRIDFSLEDAGALSSVVSILRHPATLSFEARCEGRLVGFVIVHRYFVDAPLAVCAAFSHECRGASDALYAAMLEHYRDAGARRFGLGYATGPEMLRYKTKWGTAILGRPFFQRTWARVPLPECEHWPWRVQHPNQEEACLATS